MKKLFIFAALAICSLITSQVCAQPGGGKTGDPVSKPATKSTTTPKPSTPKPTTNTRSTVNRGAIASLDGKWWTSGNDFGDSEVVLTQTGTSVTGEIHYSDGRTGVINGTLVGKRLQHTWSNSAGQSGSGWLELSWNNFLGGPWHNATVRDGSWTMMRIEGKWCFGGSRDRVRSVTHNAHGEVSVVTEDGTRDTGRLEGPWLYLASDDGQTIKGEMDFHANRMNWSSGFFWSWCGRN